VTRSERQFEAQRRALDAVSLMRHDGRSLTAAAADAGTTPATVRRHAAAALQRNGRTYRATKSDRIARKLSVLTADGLQVVTVRGSNKAAEVGRHWNAVQRHLAGHPDALSAFEGKTVAGLTLATDPATVDAFGRTGELALDDIYALPT
jgi:hypothetical protein